MRKRLVMILALAFVVGLAFAAYAEVQNVKVSGDLTVQGISRENIMLRGRDANSSGGLSGIAAGTSSNTGGPFNEYDAHVRGILSHVRVKVDADLTDNVSTTVRLINERTWGGETNAAGDGSTSSSNVGIDLAFATMKEFLYSPLTLTVGRQEVHFGNQLVIGDVDTNNLMEGHAPTPNAGDTGRFLPRSLDDLTLRKAFDAVRATLNYDPLVVDALYSKVDENGIDQNDDTDLYGVNANYALDKTKSIEAYYFGRIRKKAGGSRVIVAGSAERANDDTVHTVGSLSRYNGEKLALSLEAAFQFGTKVNNAALYPNDTYPTAGDGGRHARRAYALQLASQYKLADIVKKYEPVLSMSYTYLSGESINSNEKKYRGWDPMFENQAGGTLFNKIFGYSNAQIVNVGTTLVPMTDVQLSVQWYYLRMLRALREGTTNLATVNLTGILGDPTYVMKANKKSLGNEVDAAVTYDYTEDVQLGLSAGWFIPGSAFDKDNKKTASQVIGSMKVTF